jgi:hypothetical protein
MQRGGLGSLTKDDPRFQRKDFSFLPPSAFILPPLRD